SAQNQIATIRVGHCREIVDPQLVAVRVMDAILETMIAAGSRFCQTVGKRPFAVGWMDQALPKSRLKPTLQWVIQTLRLRRNVQELICIQVVFPNDNIRAFQQEL